MCYWLQSSFEYYSPYLVGILTSFFTIFLTNMYSNRNNINKDKNIVYLQYCKMCSIDDFYNKTDDKLKISDVPLGEVVNIAYVFVEHCVKYKIDTQLLLNHIHKICYSTWVMGSDSYNNKWEDAISDVLHDMKELLMKKPFNFKNRDLEYYKVNAESEDE